MGWIWARSAAVASLAVAAAVVGGDTATSQEHKDALVTGRVVNADGTPLASAAVTVTESPSAWERVTGLVGFVVTAGATCLGGACVPTSETSAVATDATGAFRAVLPDAHLPGFRTDTDWFVSAAVPAAPPLLGHAVVSEEFEVGAATESSPDLVLWTPPVTVDADSKMVRVVWPGLAAGRFDRGAVRYALSVVDGRGRAVWSVDRATSGAQLDARLVEDTNGSIGLVARGEITSGSTIFHQTMTAPRTPFTGAARLPQSRAAVCAVTPVGGDSAPSPGCWLTDGDLGEQRPGLPSCPTVTVPAELEDVVNRYGGPECQTSIAEAVVDLGAARPLGLVVVRGTCSCSVALSANGDEWRQAGRTSSLVGPTLVDPEGASTRYVRLRADDGGVEAVTEVSAWARVSSQPMPDDRGLIRADVASEGGLSGASVIAVAVAIVTLVAIGVALHRRNAGYR